MDTEAPAGWKRNVALFLTGQTVSLFGSAVVQYAVMWYVTFETGSGGAVALYALAAFLPQGLVSVFGGALADRFNRRVLVMVSDGTIAVVTLALAMLMSLGVTELWVILLAVGVRSVGAGVQQPAVQAMIPQLVPADQLLRINGVVGTVQAAMALAAPAAAGAVFGLFGIVPVFFIDVVTAALGIGILFFVAVPTLRAVAESTSSFRQDLVAGARYVSGQPVVRWLLVVFAIIFLLTVAPSFVTPLMVARTWGEDVLLVTLLEVAFSVGMLLGGLLLSTVLAKANRLSLVVVSCVGFGVLTIGCGLSPTLPVFYGFMFGIGLLVPLFSGPFTTLLQETTAPEMQGRVFGYVGIVMALATPIGMTVFGPFADLISVQALLVIGGALMIVVFGTAVALPSGRSALRVARASRAVLAE
ncbi:MFS transporter [Galbitalea sp. SE-J8]|uniref:MFS transporter n=1 Tax=Galbitalea sp. SE-J8 TaxID=3054952 RepID=UPI00259CB3D2|nr:MFS transporter [Galbitalea sp. SE-J8]MDM4762438.1 MFS transporter [Galbitalea sp. SE-J8]